MKENIKFVENKSSVNACKMCCLVFLSPNCKANLCHKSERKDLRSGYFIRVKSSRRQSKHERLLKALLKICAIDNNPLDGKGLLYRGRRIMVSERTEKQLIAIKEAMEKKERK